MKTGCSKNYIAFVAFDLLYKLIVLWTSIRTPSNGLKSNTKCTFNQCSHWSRDQNKKKMVTDKAKLSAPENQKLELIPSIFLSMFSRMYSHNFEVNLCCFWLTIVILSLCTDIVMSL